MTQKIRIKRLCPEERENLLRKAVYVKSTESLRHSIFRVAKNHGYMYPSKKTKTKLPVFLLNWTILIK